MRVSVSLRMSVSAIETSSNHPGCFFIDSLRLALAVIAFLCREDVRQKLGARDVSVGQWREIFTHPEAHNHLAHQFGSLFQVVRGAVEITPS